MDDKESKRSIEKSLSNVTFIGQATGLQCFSITSESLEATSGLSRKHKIFLFLNLTFLIAEVILMAFDVYRNNSGNRSGVRPEHLIQMIVYSLLIILCSVSSINNFTLRSKAKEIFKNCFRISEILSVLSQSANYTTFERVWKMTLTRLFFGWILSNIAFVIAICQQYQAIALMRVVIPVYAYFVVTILVSYWTLLIRLIGENLVFIRDCLVHLHKRHKKFSWHPETYNLDLRIRRSEEMYNFIGKLKKMYSLVHDSTLLLNQLIGVPMCVFIVFMATSTISGGYRVFLAMCDEIPFKAIAVPLCTMYTCVITLGTLVFSCSSVYNIVDEILGQIHKFEFNKLERDAGLSKITLEFACQIDQRPIQFKVGGFYCLTKPFLTTITTGIFTYVMLLVQFHSPSPK